MAMMIYTTGNGYHCGCCRQSSQDYTHFDDDDIESLIKESIELSQRADGDFYINTIEGYSGDSDELEKSIMEAIDADEKQRERKKKVNELQRNIAEIDTWFANLEITKADRTKRRVELRAQLNELEA